MAVAAWIVSNALGLVLLAVLVWMNITLRHMNRNLDIIIYHLDEIAEMAQNEQAHLGSRHVAELPESTEEK